MFSIFGVCMFEAGAVSRVGGWAVSVFRMPPRQHLTVRSQHLDLFFFSSSSSGPPECLDGRPSLFTKPVTVFVWSPPLSGRNRQTVFLFPPLIEFLQNSRHPLCCGTQMAQPDFYLHYKFSFTLGMASIFCPPIYMSDCSLNNPNSWMYNVQ